MGFLAQSPESLRQRFSPQVKLLHSVQVVMILVQNTMKGFKHFPHFSFMCTYMQLFLKFVKFQASVLTYVPKTFQLAENVLLGIIKC